MYAEQRDGDRNAAFWRERAEQLQEALESRIVIEQAKGILSERFGFGIDGAFGLLRRAARTERMKLHVLARAVVIDAETPEPIVQTLALNADTFIAVPRGLRVAQTEELFKRLNGAIATLLDGGSGAFLCECGNPLCNEPIDVDTEDLKMLHSEPRSYAIAPGHQIPDLETVVLQNDRYAVVRNTFTLH